MQGGGVAVARPVNGGSITLLLKWRNMKVNGKTLFTAAVVFVLSCAVAYPQGTAQINGSVKDATGAVLPGVEITAIQTATGISRTAVSDETGSYLLSSLPVGPYRVE